MGNTDAYIEADRLNARPVFDYNRWKTHRGSERFTRNLGNVFQSSTLRANWQEVLACTLMAVLVCAWNDVDVASLGVTLSPENMAAWASRPQLGLPALPFTVTSTFLSLLLVFRTNSAYGRWWEARCIWGAIINTCRDIVRQSLARFDPKDVELKKEVTRLVSAYPRCLIYHLGERTDISNQVIEKKLGKILSEAEKRKLMDCTHKPMTVTTMLAQSIRKARLDVIDEMKIDADLTKFSDYYGMCERIFKTPMPLSYTRLTSRFLSVWMLFMPFALYSAISPHWAIVPITAFLSFAIFGIEELGVSIEEPFSVLPLNAMADGIDGSIFEALAIDEKEQAEKKELTKA
jgi:predicted membrane chloride channel (bestrophin family)